MATEKLGKLHKYFCHLKISKIVLCKIEFEIGTFCIQRPSGLGYLKGVRIGQLSANVM